MRSWVALLRGINVGGKHTVAMARLREVVAALGPTEVSTYIQSGNVLFRAESVDPDALAATLRDAFGFEIPVVVRDAAELRAMVDRNPYPDVDPARLAVTMLHAEPAAAAVAALDPDRSPPDAFTVVGREIYLHCPNGFGRSKLTNDWFEKRLGTHGTSRNWRTVNVLAERLAAMG